MVMSKVSKAVAASFFCLTINVGGVTNAMDMEPSSNPNSMTVNTNKLDMNLNMNRESDEINIESNKRISANNLNNLNNLDNNRINEDVDVENTRGGETKGGNNDDNKDKKTDIWKILIPVFTGVGGIIVGTLLGKFAF